MHNSLKINCKSKSKNYVIINVNQLTKGFISIYQINKRIVKLY